MVVGLTGFWMPCVAFLRAGLCLEERPNGTAILIHEGH